MTNSPYSAARDPDSGNDPIRYEAENLDLHPSADSSWLGDTVPDIDVGALAGPADGHAASDAVAQIAQACRDWGFFQVVNHGVPADLMQNLWRQTEAFFALPSASKESLRRTRANPWGYYDNELTKNQRDKKEVFDYTAAGVDPIYGAENRWPPQAAGFRDTMLAYLDATTALSLQLMRAFCVGLDLPADYMEREFAGKHTGFMRLNCYPVRDPLANATIEHQPRAGMGVHHHTDAGVLTVLLQDEVGGLQVHRDGMWHDIPPVAGAFVINTGDMMQVWSNDTYQAAIHRVLAMQDRDRYSVPFFFNPPAGTRVEPLPTVVNEDRPARYRGIDWADYRGKRTDGDYADYGTEVQISQFLL
ncbi:MAG: isopenicillin N synthase family oxygenase [Gammaproteobacteria bacterium]|nr:MAG: isopenicillin N synthase family oxygenase [Gammaproteobacteria bacterium]